MMISRFCKDCGSKNTFDDSKEKFYCSICGAVNQVDRQNASSDNGEVHSALHEDKNVTKKEDLRTVSGFVPLSAASDLFVNNSKGINPDTNVAQEEENKAKALDEESTFEGGKGNENKTDKKSSKKIAKVIVVFMSILIGISLIVGVILFFVNRIPPEYYGTYVRYWYLGGSEAKTTYKISALSVKEIIEINRNGELETNVIDCKYTKKGDDLIISVGTEDSENYLILDDDCLYVESSRDISLSKRFGFFYWNEKSDKADIYEIENKAFYIKRSIEDTMDTWARELVFTASDIELKDTIFYIQKSDEKTDDSDTNTYEVKYAAAGGELSLFYNRNTRELESVRYFGSIAYSSLVELDYDSMSIEDTYDVRAMILSFMYVLGNENNIDLNSKVDSSHYSEDYDYRLEVVSEFSSLLSNMTYAENYGDEYTFSLNNDKYNVDYVINMSESNYHFTEGVWFNIRINN